MAFILFILLLSIIIVIHEAGHLLAAKFFNVYCHEFSLGMGPLIYQIKGKETLYSLRLIPIGGFVAMHGDNENDLETKVDIDIPNERSLLGIAPYKRIIVQMAGIVMNFILAISIIAGIFLYQGSYAVAPDAVISDVSVDSPAYKAGLLKGDKILKISFDNGIAYNINDMNELTTYMSTYTDGKIKFDIIRDNEKFEISLIPIYSKENGRYLIGISSEKYKIIDVNLLNCIPLAFDYCLFNIKTIIISLMHLLRGVGLENMSGPVGIYKVTEQAVSMGILTYLMMLALISLNIGIMNALPLPILDGGRVLITLFEMLFKKPISKKVESTIMGISIFLLLALFVFVTFQDIIKMF